MRRTALAFALVLVATLLGPTSGVAANGPHLPGAAGVGDPYYPNYGNGGYDVQHYDLVIRYRPKTDFLWGTATIDAVATQGLSSFNLDFVGLAVRSIAVEGETAAWSRTEHELTVVPAAPIDLGAPFTTQVVYKGVPWTTYDPFGPGLQVGFMHTDDGAIVSGEPDVAAFWYPANDHPQDRATYTFEVTVPSRYGVVANGLPVGTTSNGRRTTHRWRANDPMPAYLATIDIGEWIIDSYVTDRGLPVIDAIDPDGHRAAQTVLSREEEILAFLEDTFGPYPFESAGAIVDDHPGYQFSMEMQTRPVYPSADMKRGLRGGWASSLVVHELSHMWYGNLVAVNRWKDIWLNEGPASYAEWLWAEYEGQATPQEILEAIWVEIPADSRFWQIVIGDPGAAHMFHGAVYVRGAMTMQALRNEVGDEAFWQILAEWLDANALATGSAEEFTALAEEVSGKDLDAFFQTWLFNPEKPPASAVQSSAGGQIRTERAATWAAAWLNAVELRTGGAS
jgi:aminopeptidase N